MSEKEKKRRALYRKNREKWIFTQTVIAVVVALAVLISAIVYINLNEEQYVTYQDGGTIDYNVYLKDNDFYEKPLLGKDQSYVASLIDQVVANFNYQMDMDEDNVNYHYSYTIKSRLEIIDNASKAPIYNPEYELVSVKDELQSSSKRLSINEIIVINYDEYNDLANKFLSTYSLTSTTSNIVVTLTVDVLGDSSAFASSTAENYVSELRIPLTTKTVNVNMTCEAKGTENKTVALAGAPGSEIFKITAIVLGVIDALLVLLLVAFIYLTRTEDITYTARVKKIISQYKSYIQKINNLFDTNGYQVIMVDTFDEMLEIRDTIQAPILMYENEDKTSTSFMIPTDSKLLYVYRIMIEVYANPEPVSNISAVVDEVEVEAIAYESTDVVADGEPSEAVVSQFEEILNSIPSADEAFVDDNTVEVIDIVWEEKANKTYRYDPDGNEVEEGDVVLVPTRDDESDREVVREAEVARGNYRIDQSEITSPLKKIIGVVRRRAEKVFVAMIEPDGKFDDKE